MTSRNYYFVGIAGTGMAPAAILLKQAGYDVGGCDEGLYPPMSTMLEENQIAVDLGMNFEHLVRQPADTTFVIANVLSKPHPLVQYILNHNRPYGSFPSVLKSCLLTQTTPIVVCGCHGKTTTTSLAAHMLSTLGESPSFLIGGIPKNFGISARLDRGRLFIIEGDEYDTAFFDKKSKFLHYNPRYIILNNIEFDHADIFADLAAVEDAFAEFLALIPDPNQILANIDDPGVCRLLKRLGLENQVSRISTLGQNTENADFTGHSQPPPLAHEATLEATWRLGVTSRRWPLLNRVYESSLVGHYNMANTGQVLALLGLLLERGEIKGLQNDTLATGLKQFLGVKRRLDFLGKVKNLSLFEDFAHHPTAVRHVIDDFMTTYPGLRLAVAFEPRNATSRRNIFEDIYPGAFAKATYVLLGECFQDPRIPAEQRMDTRRLAAKIGHKALAFTENRGILEWILEHRSELDAVVFMSSGSFSGIPRQTLQALEASPRIESATLN